VCPAFPGWLAGRDEVGEAPADEWLADVGRGRPCFAGLSGQGGVGSMELDKDKIDEAALALLRLTLHDQRRAWKGFDWAVLDRLYRKGLIADPVGKAKSVVLTDAGLERSAALLVSLFGRHPSE
jgi:hypothetical protein